MSRSSSSRRWLKEHHSDPYLARARAAGYRSRAAYKLLELDRRDKLFAGVRTVVDLGAAPGGWSQVAARAVGREGQVVATDIVDIEAIEGVQFVKGDFRDIGVREEVMRIAGGRAVDLVISDMAPNLSGMRAMDLPRVLQLAELAGEFAATVLRPGGVLLVKLFEGEGVDAYRSRLARSYRRVVIRKPRASRGRSSEHYVLARGYGV
jgi:23S rRNA (uridine2552-2'-O)-methyltransferase